MDPIYIFLTILAGVLLVMGFFVSFLQKRITKMNLNNTMSLTKKFYISDIKKPVDKDINTITTKDPIILKHSDAEMLDFIDDEII